MTRSVEEIVREAWGDVGFTYEPLGGGYVNFTYKVALGGRDYVLRINGDQNSHLELSRESENDVYRRAGEMGIAPNVLPQSNAEYLITEFIDARILSREEFRKPDILATSIEVLKKIHSIDNHVRKLSPFDLINRYLQGMRALKVPVPAELGALLAEMDVMEKRWRKDESYRRAYCHNDCYGANILNANGRLYAIDWELSGEGDIFFDLATISFCNAFTQEEDERLLACYFGKVEEEYRVALYDMKYMNMLREATWGLLHSGMEETPVNHGMNYLDWGMQNIQWLKEGRLHI